MIDHVIAFRAPDLTDEEGEELLAQLGRLRDVPGVVELVVGRNFGERSRGFDYCLRATFADAEALQAYDLDPLHLEVVRYNRAVTVEHICVDFAWQRLDQQEDQPG